MYKNIKLLNYKEHNFYRYTAPDNLYFSKDLNLVPITFTETALLCCEFPIVIIKGADGLMLTILTGEKSNNALDESGKWSGDYLPAFIRKYPFILSKVADNDDKLHIAFDMESGCFNSPEGEPLFDSNGEPSAIIKDSMKLLESIAKEMNITSSILNRLDEYGVLDESSYTVNKEGEEPRQVGGFYIINREKISKLDDEKLLTISKNGWMQMIELHSLSLKNINRLG